MRWRQKDVHTIPEASGRPCIFPVGLWNNYYGNIGFRNHYKRGYAGAVSGWKECKIRSIQVHGQDQQKCYAGQRVAINLSNIKKKEISRGCVLAPPNSMKNTDLLDVKLNVLESSMRILTNHTRLHLLREPVRFCVGRCFLIRRRSVLARVVSLQLRLEEEIAVRRGDKFVVRFYSPMETIGGGVILEPNPRIKKRFQQDVIEELRQKESGSSADIIEMHAKQYADTLITTAELAKLTALSAQEISEDIEELEEKGIVRVFPMRKDTYIWHADSERAAKETLTEALMAYEAKYPYRYGMKKAEIQMTYFRR